MQQSVAALSSTEVCAPYRATRFHTDIQPAVTVSAKHSKPVIGADFDLNNQVPFLPMLSQKLLCRLQ